MELRIRNPYINKFLQRFSNENELKIIKYLTILGIQSLQASNRSDISFSELKQTAKSISKSSSKQGKKINKELSVIKDELAKLNQKFEEKLKGEFFSPNGNKEEEAQRSVSVPRVYGEKTLIKKPPSRWKADQNLTPQKLDHNFQENTRRANSIQPFKEYNWQETHRRGSNQTYSITPKPNEIPFPRVDPRENRNYVTRHHLDDTEAKRVMTEEGVIYFPEKEKMLDGNDRNKGARSLSHNRVKQESRNVEPLPQRKLSEAENRSKDKMNTGKTLSNKESSKSPKVMTPKENIPDIINTMASRNVENTRNTETENSQRRSDPKSHRKKDSTKRKSNKAKENRKETHYSKTQQQKILRDKAKNVGRMDRRHTNQTIAGRSSANEYSHVESKIRDKLEYDKEYSRRHQKVRQSIPEYTYQNDEEDFSNDYEYPKRDKKKEKFLFVEKDARQGFIKERAVDQSLSSQPVYRQATSVLESPSSSQPSMEIKQSPSQYYNRSPYESLYLGESKRSEVLRNNGNLSHSKNSATRGFGGMLDIANSFLNSPFMRHLSNLEGKSPQDSLESSIIPSESASVRDRDYYDDGRGTGDMKASLDRRGSGKKKYTEDESRIREDYYNEGRYQEVVSHKGNSRPNKESFIINESVHKRPVDYSRKDSEPNNYDESKDQESSFDNTQFDNFADEEMIGFFQKEILDLERPKDPRSIARSSANSSHISFNASEFTTNFKGVNNSHFKKRSFKNAGGPTRHNNKSYVGEARYTPNVFKQERMSVTQLLNTS